MSESSVLTLRNFLLRRWLWHFLLTLIFAIILLLIVRVHYTHQTATRTDFLLNLGTLIVCWVHTLLILIFSMRRFSRKQIPAGGIFLVHFFLSAFLSFYAYMMINIGWIYALKGH